MAFAGSSEALSSFGSDTRSGGFNPVDAVAGAMSAAQTENVPPAQMINDKEMLAAARPQNELPINMIANATGAFRQSKVVATRFIRLPFLSGSSLSSL
jgi:hypothetical protein